MGGLSLAASLGPCVDGGGSGLGARSAGAGTRDDWGPPAARGAADLTLPVGALWAARPRGTTGATA